MARKEFVVTSYDAYWQQAQGIVQRNVPTKDLATAKEIGDAQYMGGALRVTITDPLGSVRLHKYEGEELHA